MADAQAISAPRKSSRNTAGNIAKKNRGWRVAAAFLGILTVALVFWWAPQRSTSGTEGTGQSTLPLETFVVNLNGSGQRAYLRVGITLGLARPLSRNPGETMPLALVRDTILSVLAEAQSETLLGGEGKRQLKDQVLKALQERVPQIAVTNVYFTEFLVQM